MVVRGRATVVAGGVVGVGQFDRESAADERFEALVHCGQRNAGKELTDCEEDFVRRRMHIRIIVHSPERRGGLESARSVPAHWHGLGNPRPGGEARACVLDGLEHHGHDDQAVYEHGKWY